MNDSVDGIIEITGSRVRAGERTNKRPIRSPQENANEKTVERTKERREAAPSSKCAIVRVPWPSLRAAITAIISPTARHKMPN